MKHKILLSSVQGFHPHQCPIKLLIMYTFSMWFGFFESNLTCYLLCHTGHMLTCSLSIHTFENPQDQPRHNPNIFQDNKSDTKSMRVMPMKGSSWLLKVFEPSNMKKLMFKRLHPKRLPAFGRGSYDLVGFLLRCICPGRRFSGKQSSHTSSLGEFKQELFLKRFSGKSAGTLWIKTDKSKKHPKICMFYKC